MKRPKDNVFKLIQSMSPAEKRYLKRHYASENNLLTDLFNLINGMEAYDEELVKEKFKTTNLAKNLKVYKIQLADLILKSLVSYHSKKNEISKVRVGLEEVDILFEKQLHDIAKEKLDKLNQICIKFELFNYLIEVQQKSFFLGHVRNDKVGLSNHSFFKEIPNCINALNEEFEISRISNEAFDFFRKEGHRISVDQKNDFINEILSNRLIQMDESELSFRARLSRNTLLALIFKMKQETWKEYGYKRANLQLFEDFPYFKKILPFRYIGVLRNYINVALDSKKDAEISRIIKEAENFANKTPFVKQQLIYFYFALLKREFEKGNFNWINDNLDKKVMKHLSDYDQMKDRIALISIYFLALSAIGRKSYRQAQRYIELLFDQAKGFNGYFDEAVNILELINLSETNDDLVIESKLRSIRRKLRNKSQAISPFYERVLLLFKNIIQTPFDKQVLIEQFLKEAPEFRKERVYFVFSFFFLHCWCYAQVEKLTLQDAIIAYQKEKV